MMLFMLSNWDCSTPQTSQSWLAHKVSARTIVTADLDYPRLLALARSAEPSLILFRDGNWSEADVVTRLREVLYGLSDVDIAQSIIVVDRDRVRRRRLPIVE
jgi:predicted nuclease of predicted toxin-antitoxin system